MIVAGDRVVILAESDAKTKRGQPYCNRYCFVFRIGGDLVREVTEFLDTALVETVILEKELA